MKILMVDDNNFSLQVAKNTLIEGKINCEIVMCNSGYKALEILESEDIDIILLDIIMPEITGVEVLKQIRMNPHNKDIQILMLTATTDKFSLKECFDSGANDFINKPIEPIDFIARVNAAIRVRKYHKELNRMLALTMKQNQELNEMTKKLKEAQLFLIQKEKMAAIGELAAGVAHEINNPMGFISSNFETLVQYISKIKNMIKRYREIIDKIDDPEDNYDKLIEEKAAILELENAVHLEFVISDLDDLIKDSREGVERVTNIVQSLKRFARTGLEDDFNYHSIDEIIEEALMITRNEVKYFADIKMELCDLDPVYCNRGQIGQVIVNMVINAVQAIKSQQRQEKGCICINTYMEDDNIVIKISDDGPGIKEEIMAKIFDPFFTTKDVGEGTGLGLSICYDIIVNKHKGQLSANSNINEGTDFFIKLPIT
ncbi:response regulator [Petroclostridium sp. X23]|uniref:response regulator n=1 Tax=Petroclostridium sp. X23 TaxID=3045146 RepID=UPI0024AE53B4|nr:response regulator [Petroclostridium sp. X23]WHH59013.1 response regulator [Petroclostridium sp. X23]